MKIEEQILKQYSITMACAVPLHLYRRLNKRARESGRTKSEVLREILSKEFGYICKQYKSRGRKIYLYRKEN